MVDDTESKFVIRPDEIEAIWAGGGVNVEYNGGIIDDNVKICNILI